MALSHKNEEFSANTQIEESFCYRRWVFERSAFGSYHYESCTSYSYIFDEDNKIKMDVMFSKKIKLLMFRSVFEITLITEDGEIYDWSRDRRIYNDECDPCGYNMYDDGWYPPRPTRVSFENDKHFLYIYPITNGLSNVRFKKAVASCNTFRFPWMLDTKDQQFFGITDTGKVYHINLNLDEGTPLKQLNIKEKVTNIACGSYFFVIVTDNGKIYNSNYINNENLEVCTDAYEYKNLYEVVKLSGNSVVKVVCGGRHTLVLTDKDKVYTWSNDHNLQICNNFIFPDMLNTCAMGKVLDIAAAYDMNIIKTEDGLFHIQNFAFCHDYATKIDLSCECTNVFDMCNALWSSSSVCTERAHLPEESNILDVLETAFNDHNTSDLAIKVEGKCIYVHKVFLKIRSEYFRRKFAYNWAGNNQTVIEHKYYSHIVYKAFLKYLYTGTINISLENKLELLDLANEYCEENLKKDCIWMIKKDINKTNVHFVFKIAVESLYDMKVLEEYCVQFFCKNFKDVINAENWTSSFDESKDLLFKKAHYLIRSMEKILANPI